MSVADTRPMPLQRLLPWWPGAVLAAAVAALLALTAQQGWLGDVPELSWAVDPVGVFADWKMAVALGVVLALLLGVVADALALRRWRREIVHFDPTAPQAHATWTYAAYSESLRSLDERHDLGDVRLAVQRRKDKLARRVTQGCVFKYYVLCFALPFAGLLLGLVNLSELGGALPFADLFRPLLLGTVGPLVVLALAVLLARGAKLALDTWEEKALQLAQRDQGRKTMVAETAPTMRLPQLGFRDRDLELGLDAYCLQTVLALSAASDKDVEVALIIRGNAGHVREPRNGKVVIPAGQTELPLSLALEFNPAGEDRLPDLSLEISSPKNASLGKQSKQAVRWRRGGGGGGGPPPPPGGGEPPPKRNSDEDLNWEDELNQAYRVS